MEFKCCICGEIFSVQNGCIPGNNPFPVRQAKAKTGKANRCCDMCNEEFVTSFREYAMSVNMSPEDREMFHEDLQNYSYKSLITYKELLFKKAN